MEIKTIKGISAEKWIEFKTLAAKKNVHLGKLFEIMIENYADRGDLFWEEVLGREKILSDSEAEELLKKVKKLRKDRGFRI